MKKILCLFLALVLLCTCGCGSEGKTDDGETGSSVTGVSQSAPATSSESTQTEATEPESAETRPTETEATETEPEVLPDYHFSKMEYVRPDAQVVLDVQQKCATLSQGENWYALSDAVMEYIGHYYHFETMNALAMIHYYLDLSDPDWMEEYQYCSANMVTLNAERDRLFYTLAGCDYVELLEKNYFSKGFFLNYEDESIWTEEFSALMEEETRLQNQYYSLSAQLSGSTTTVSGQLTDLLVEMVKLRQRIATVAGYDSYGAFAYEFYFGRDYSDQQAKAYIDQVRTEVAPLYQKLSMDSSMSRDTQRFSEEETFEYVHTIADHMGGTVSKAFEQMETGALYDITRSNQKLSGAFTQYLRDYGVSFVFVSAHGDADDPVAFTHEFGHFCQGYGTRGVALNMDTAEVFSQGMEALSMSYGDGTLNRYQLFKLLSAYVEEAASADFELRLYALPEEEVTPETISKLYAQTASEWGLIYTPFYNSAGYVYRLHFYILPMYTFSYTVSCDVAMQLYEMEQQEPGTGLSCYEKCLRTTKSQLLSFVEEAGLRSPFAEGRVQEIRDLFTEELKQ